MECDKCRSEEIETKIVKTEYTFFAFIEECIKIDNAKFKCKKCGYEWLEAI